MHQKHFSETTFTNYFYDLKGIQTGWHLILLETSLENRISTHFSELLIDLRNLGCVHICLWGKINAFLFSRGSTGLFWINVLCFDTSVLIGLNFLIFLDIGLFSCEFIDTLLNCVDWQISFLNQPVVILDLFENIVSVVGVELVIVF